MRSLAVPIIPRYQIYPALIDKKRYLSVFFPVQFPINAQILMSRREKFAEMGLAYVRQIKML